MIKKKSRMAFDIITIFPDCFDSYFNTSLLKKAQEKGIIKIKVHNLRNWANDKRRTVDDSPYGGGPGMLMKVEPIFRAVDDILPIRNYQGRGKVNKNKKTKIILFSAKGKPYDQKAAERLSKMSRLIMICGRYEGVDERVAKYIADEEISLGPYVLSGGEIGAMILVESISRLLPGVIGKEESLKEESFSQNFILEYPQYTRPPKFYPLKNKNISWNVPKILLSGHHQKIEEFKRKRGKRRIEAENEKKQQPK